MHSLKFGSWKSYFRKRQSLTSERSPRLRGVQTIFLETDSHTARNLGLHSGRNTSLPSPLSTRERELIPV